jgi:hypothetical protein
MTGRIMRELELEIQYQYPELSCELREAYHDWKSRTRSINTHWHEEVRDINSFLNWQLLSRYREHRGRDNQRLHEEVRRARNSLGTLNRSQDVAGWIRNLMDRYFPTYIKLDR